MSDLLELPDQLVLHDVLAFIDSCEGQSAGRYKKQRAKDAPDYERNRRERKKAERETLRRQVVQFEAQLELLRLRNPSPSRQSGQSKWRWLETAMDEDERRREAEELNRQLRGCLVEHMQTTQEFRTLVDMQSTLATRVQAVVSRGLPNVQQIQQIPPNTFVGHEAISVHLKERLHRLYPSPDSVFRMSHLLGDEISSDLESLSSSVRIKQQDPIAGPCIELSSTTPLGCKYEDAAAFVWEMLLAREMFGPDTSYTVKKKELTEQSAEMAYSMVFGSGNTEGILDGVTLMKKCEQDNRTMLIWTSLLVQSNGKACFTSQGWITITRLPSSPEVESTVRTCSRISGSHFGIIPGASSFDMRKARKQQLLARARMDGIQRKILNRVEKLNNE